MNIVCDKTLLSAAIDGVSKAVTMRSSIPVLEGILLKAEGFQLTLTGYDLEMSIVTTIEANIKEPGEIVLNAKLLSSMISRMPAGQISIVAADNGKTTIQSGVAQFEIQSMPATDFPDLPNTGAEQTLTIKTGVLRDMIDRTLYAVSQDEKKPAHTGELFEIELDKLTMSDSDGYIYDPEGITREKLDYIMELKQLYRGRIREYAEEYPGVKYVAGARPWGEKCDIAMPSATQNEIDGDDARQLLANGVIAVSEGANMPSTPEAVDAFLEAGILYAPGKAANAGGVSVSGPCR